MRNCHLTNIKRAVVYIESNLTDQISIEELADKGHLSQFHFYRVFHEITGLTPAEYIRFRRLSAAAGELAAGTDSIIDIAVKYGYASQEAFSRAFLKLFNTNPGEYRRRKPAIKLYSESSILGLVSHQRKISLDKNHDICSFSIYKPARRIIAIKNPEPQAYKQCYETDFFADCTKTLSQIKNILMGPFGLVIFEPDIEHYIGVETDMDSAYQLPYGCESFTREACQYEVFYHAESSWKYHHAQVQSVRDAADKAQKSAARKAVPLCRKTPLYETCQEQLGFAVYIPTFQSNR